jgi:hypothetical protein
MKPEYRQVRFQALHPLDGWPVEFGVVTPCNPNGVTAGAAKNARAVGALRAVLEAEGLAFFEVTGGSADLAHAELGFGIVASLDVCLALGRRWEQEAIFWVAQGVVSLVGCHDELRERIGTWESLLEGRMRDD